MNTMASNDAQHLKADLLILTVTILAAFGWLFSKETLAGIAPILFIGVRFVAAGAIVSIPGFKQLKALSRKDLVFSAQVGLMFGIALIFWILGLHHGQHVGIGAFLTSLGVVLVPFVSLLFGERPSAATWYSLPVVGAGLACLSLDGEFQFGLGEWFYLTAAFLFAVTFTLNSRASARIPTLPLSAIQLLVAGSLALMVSAVLEDWQWPEDSDTWLWFAASIFIATSLRFSLQTKAQGMAPASHAAIIMTLEPVWTALIASIWLAETMSMLQLAGCALIFAAMLVSRWRVVVMLIRGRKAPA